jgi:3-deoxy-manno-octulosonate cytidylyltransferase (CMP-KDO synthetase)
MLSWDQWLIIIPARLGSTRLPDKPLVDLGGKPLIVRVYERVQSLKNAGAKIIVATDSEAVVKACEEYGVSAQMTRSDHTSGTDRCYEVASRFDHRFVMNVQGDEPFVDVNDLTALAKVMSSQESPQMGTLVYESSEAKDFTNPNVVKAVRSDDGYALYFSRSAIPYTRESANRTGRFWHHQGIYAFSRETLGKFCQLPQSPLEKLEALEQLRALENKISICLVPANKAAIGIDTPEDLEEARAKF